MDEIRKRLKSSNSYVGGSNGPGHVFDGQRSGLKQFDDEFSVLYKIPKRSTDLSYTNNNQTFKNLDYQS